MTINIQYIYLFTIFQLCGTNGAVLYLEDR